MYTLETDITVKKNCQNLGVFLWGTVLRKLCNPSVKKKKKLIINRAIKELESDNSKKTYGIPIVFEKPLLKSLKPMYYPTACKTPLGLVIIATREIITRTVKSSLFGHPIWMLPRI
jgi:hypothetical protein